MSISDDLRAAADYVYECSGSKIALLALVTRLRDHAAEVEQLQARDKALMSKLGNFKGSGNVELDAALQTPDPAFDAFRDSMPENYWARYDLTAVRLGWHYRGVAARQQHDDEVERVKTAWHSRRVL